jgi:hypothetical protein
MVRRRWLVVPLAGAVLYALLGRTRAFYWVSARRPVLPWIEPEDGFPGLATDPYLDTLLHR